MSPRTEPLVVCVHHPAAVDVKKLEAAWASLPCHVDLRIAPYKEKVKLRLARQRPPLSAELLALAPEVDEHLRRAWRESEVLLTLDLPIERLDDMPRLAWVQAYSAGLEQFSLSALAGRNIALTNAAGAGAPAIAEFVFGRLIEVFRNLRGIEEMQRARDFHRPGGQTLSGRTLGIIGLGAIGGEVARLGRALGMRTIGSRRSARPGDSSPLVDRLLGPDGLSEILSESDVLVLCAPATAETSDLIDAAAFEQMKPGAVLVNVARGRLVDEGALVAALESEHLAAAILDVTREEPLPKDSPLWDAPNLYLSPHSSIPPDAYDARLLELFAENVRRYALGEALVNRIDLPAVEASLGD